MLGRACKLRDAYEFIKGIRKQGCMEGTLLTACSYHGHAKLEKEVAETESDNASYYISLLVWLVGKQLYG